MDPRRDELPDEQRTEEGLTEIHRDMWKWQGGKTRRHGEWEEYLATKKQGDFRKRDNSVQWTSSDGSVSKTGDQCYGRIILLKRIVSGSHAQAQRKFPQQEGHSRSYSQPQEHQGASCM